MADKPNKRGQVTPLKIALVTRGMTIRELAERISRSEESVGRWVNGRLPVHPITRRVIALELDTTVDELWPEPEQDQQAAA